MATTLRKNIKGLYVSLAQTGLAIIALCVFTTILFQQFIGLGTRVERYILIGMWIVLPAMWAIGALVARTKWDKTSYSMTGDAITLSTQHIGRGVQSDLYRYDAIIAVRVRTPLGGAVYGYGDVYLEIPRMNRTVALRYLEQPARVAEKIKQHVASQSATKASSGI